MQQKQRDRQTEGQKATETDEHREIHCADRETDRQNQGADSNRFSKFALSPTNQWSYISSRTYAFIAHI